MHSPGQLQSPRSAQQRCCSILNTYIGRVKYQPVHQFRKISSQHQSQRTTGRCPHHHHLSAQFMRYDQCLFSRFIQICRCHIQQRLINQQTMSSQTGQISIDTEFFNKIVSHRIPFVTTCRKTMQIKQHILRRLYYRIRPHHNTLISRLHRQSLFPLSHIILNTFDTNIHNRQFKIQFRPFQSRTSQIHHQQQPHHSQRYHITFLHIYTISIDNNSNALAAAFAIFRSRVKEKTYLRAKHPRGVATPIQTVPTGFSGVPPAGPATPEVATA